MIIRNCSLILGNYSGHNPDPVAPSRGGDGPPRLGVGVAPSSVSLDSSRASVLQAAFGRRVALVLIRA
jgi:hypothetical protein